MSYESNFAPTTTDKGNVFDQTYNTFSPSSDQPAKPGSTTQPRRDFGERPEAPKPFNQQGISPDHAFDDAYNLLPSRRPFDGKEGPFDSKFNSLNKPGDFPAFKGRPQPFNQNGEVGKMYIDERSGLVLGMEFTAGSRTGQKQVFERDASGSLSKMHFLTPGQERAPSNYSIFEKGDSGWTSKPAGQSVPGCKHLQIKDGTISGDFKINGKGDFSYESADKQTKNILRLNGEKDFFNMREYSRERESINGQKNTTYWSGYEWLPGQKETVATGITKVTFQQQPAKPGSGELPKPAYTIRDANCNGFQVEFTTEKTAYKVENWNHGKMTRVHNGATDTIYSTGTQDSKGHLQWRKGQEKVESGQRVVQFNDVQDATKVAAGEIPQGAIINLQSGEVTSVYANGTRLTADNYGQTKQIAYRNQQTIEILRDTNNEFRGFKRSDGTLILKGADTNLTSGPQGGAAWAVQRPGQQAVQFTGVLRHGNSGAFEVLNAGNEGVSVTSEGAISTKIGGKIVNDTVQPATPEPRPNETRTPGSSDVQPPKSDAPQQVKPDEPLKPGDAQPGDKRPDKSNVTDAQLLALAAKHKVNARVLAQARERAEKQGLAQTFTEQNVDKLLELATKHKLIGDFTDGGVSSMSRPGAVAGKLIPELLAEPDTAVGKLQTQMRANLQKALRDGGAPQTAIDRALQTMDQRFSSLRTNTQPFIKELKTALVAQPSTPQPIPEVTPTPGPKNR
ncbi:hypothetical protein KF728_20635 [Candidatus Obscuribacterales bacterium]|nr:hypothetical protein [Candidatus Obscuribacterales bacterium]